MNGGRWRRRDCSYSSRYRCSRSVATDPPLSSISSSSGDRRMRATPVRRPSRWRVGFLLPRTLVACIVLDALLRFAPVGWRPMEAGEAEVRHRIPGEAFARNLHIESSAAYGDLARIGNFRELREYRSYSFTTDEHGFRKGRRGSAAVAVVFGDSFAQAGRDGETLADQLAQVIGC